ncbi:hypothetical protein ACFQL7_27770 [Halocatena marina]|uniref:Uncharacterized protein n=1 Tax=Halocatena marina TaxID=2934937 RepID=A0ABD5YZ56_9EURY
MGTYGISCADCMLSDWQYETRTQAEKAKEAHRHDNGCRGFLIDVVHTDVELLNTNDDQPLIDPNNPPLDEQFDDESYDIPAGIGYRLAGNRPLRALIGPGAPSSLPRRVKSRLSNPEPQS